MWDWNQQNSKQIQIVYEMIFHLISIKTPQFLEWDFMFVFFAIIK